MKGNYSNPRLEQLINLDDLRPAIENIGIDVYFKCINLGKSFGNHIRNNILKGNFDMSDIENQLWTLLFQIGETDLISDISTQYAYK